MGHSIDQGVIVRLNRVKNRIDFTLEEYKDPSSSLVRAEMNLRQAIHVLREVRKELILSKDY